MAWRARLAKGRIALNGAIGHSLALFDPNAGFRPARQDAGPLTARVIPSYELYGELLSGSHTDPIHHEPLRDRSSRHDWTIRLHRHRRLAQIFLFRTPGVSVRLGELDHVSTEPLFLVIPAGVPHAFRFSEDVLGDVISLRIDDLPPDMAARIAQFGTTTGGVLPQGALPEFSEVAGLVDQLGAVYTRVGPERGALLDAIARLIVTYLAAARPRPQPPGPATGPQELSHHQRVAERFCELIEDRFDAGWRVADFARAVGVSTPHLNRVCRKILGASPNELVRQRRLLEAKRLLEYTRLPISEVAHKSGFRDPAFFSRSFKKGAGISPLAYRSRRD